MPTLTLLVEDEPGRGRWVHWDGIEVLTPKHAEKIEAMPHGTRFTADCRYTRDGLVLREIKQALAERGPTPAQEVRRLIDTDRPQEALDKLASFPAGSVDTDPALLDLRMRAHAALKRGAEVGQDFAKLLTLPNLEAPDARRAFQILSPQTRPFFALRFAQWAAQNFERVKRWGADYVLEGIEVPQWPLDLVLAEIGRLLGLPAWSAALGDGSALQTLLQRARAMAENDPRVVAIGPKVEAKLTELQDPNEYDPDEDRRPAPTEAARQLWQLPPGWTAPSKPAEPE
jgi:hypothetical protein